MNKRKESVKRQAGSGNICGSLSRDEQIRLMMKIQCVAESYQDDDESCEDDGSGAITGHWWNVACRELGHPEMEVEE